MSYCYISKQVLNSLTPVRCGSCFKNRIPEHMLGIKFMSTSQEITFMWMPSNTLDDKSTLVLIMAWYRKHQVITWANVDSDLIAHGVVMPQLIN